MVSAHMRIQTAAFVICSLAYARSYSTLRKVKQKPVPQAVPGKIGMLDTLSNSFLSEGEAGDWGF